MQGWQNEELGMDATKVQISREPKMAKLNSASAPGYGLMMEGFHGNIYQLLFN